MTAERKTAGTRTARPATIRAPRKPRASASPETSRPAPKKSRAPKVPDAPAARKVAGPRKTLTLKPAPKPAPAPAPVPEPVAPVLSERQLRHLRGLGHGLKPLVRLGTAGLTPAVAAETSRALHDHELIKVKAVMADRGQRNAIFEELARLTASAVVHRIGHIAVLYRPRADMPKLLIPD